jgi:hypothetical protein
MATVQIFSVRFGSLDLSCTRDMAQGLYILSSRDCRCAISPDDASRLAGALALLQWRGHVAVAKSRPMKAGPVFKRAWPSFTVELGINSFGDAVYLQVGDLRADLDEGQLAILLAVLGQLDADVTTVRRSRTAAPDDDMRYGVARGLRDAGLPAYWAGIEW